MRGFFREALADAERGQPVEDPELALAQPLVDDRSRRTAGERALLADDLGGLLRADIGRGQDDLAAARRAAATANQRPAASACCDAELRQRHVDVAHVDVDLVRAGFIGRIARDIALALPVPDQPQPLAANSGRIQR